MLFSAWSALATSARLCWQGLVAGAAIRVMVPVEHLAVLPFLRAVGRSYPGAPDHPDLQVYRRSELERQVVEFRPQAVGFSLNYLANVPEVVDLAKWVKTVLPGCLVFVGGHSVSFVAEQVLAHAGGPGPPPCSPPHRTGRWPKCPAR
jgi:hypothetical protein